MHTPQTIVIIGTGATGKGLAASLAGASFRVLLCGHDFPETSQFIEQLQTAHPFYDVEALSCSYEASWEADMIILAISASHQPEVAERIQKVAIQKVVITTQDNLDELQKMMPFSKVVQAFTGLDAAAFQQPPSQRKGRTVAVVTTDEEAGAMAARLVSATGFTPQVQEGAAA